MVSAVVTRRYGGGVGVRFEIAGFMGDAVSLEQNSQAKASARKISSLNEAEREAREREMGRALRSVYDEAVQEPVPDDLLDLLGKLG